MTSKTLALALRLYTGPDAVSPDATEALAYAFPDDDASAWERVSTRTECADECVWWIVASHPSAGTVRLAVTDGGYVAAAWTLTPSGAWSPLFD